MTEILSWISGLCLELFSRCLGVVAIVGILVSLLLGLTVAISLRATATSGTSHLEIPFLLAQDAEMFQRYQAISESLLKASRNPDPIYREIALEQIDELTRKAAVIAEETFVFEETATWRIVYGRLLQSPGPHLYRSVAWVKNANYWQDESGWRSMAVNFELHAAERLNVERIAISSAHVWIRPDAIQISDGSNQSPVT